VFLTVNVVRQLSAQYDSQLYVCLNGQFLAVNNEDSQLYVCLNGQFLAVNNEDSQLYVCLNGQFPSCQ